MSGFVRAYGAAAGGTSCPGPRRGSVAACGGARFVHYLHGCHAEPNQRGRTLRLAGHGVSRWLCPRIVDVEVPKEIRFKRHGLSVSVGPETTAPGGDAQLIVRHADDWKWDLVMYLWSFDVMVFDSHSKVLLATGSWKNSHLHGFHDSTKVVAEVVDQTFGKLNQ